MLSEALFIQLPGLRRSCCEQPGAVVWLFNIRLTRITGRSRANLPFLSLKRFARRELSFICARRKDLSSGGRRGQLLRPVVKGRAMSAAKGLQFVRCLGWRKVFSELHWTELSPARLDQSQVVCMKNGL